MFGATPRRTSTTSSRPPASRSTRKDSTLQPGEDARQHEVKIKLHPDVAVELPFDVVSENPIEPVATEEKPAGEKTEKRSERTDRPDRRPRKETKE